MLYITAKDLGITVMSLKYLSFSKIYFISQNAFHNVTSCTKLTFLITNSNAKSYYCELQVTKIRLISLWIVIILGFIMLPSRFVLCDVTICAIGLPNLRSIRKCNCYNLDKKFNLTCVMQINIL